MTPAPERTKAKKMVAFLTLQGELEECIGIELHDYYLGNVAAQPHGLVKESDLTA